MTDGAPAQPAAQPATTSPAPPEHPAVAALRARFADAILDVEVFRGETSVRVDRAWIVPICRFLHDEPGLRYEMLTSLTAVHYPRRPRQFDLVYHLTSLQNRDRLRLMAAVGEGETIDSVTAVWAGANWQEREAFDMFGVVFANHPDLRRILLPEDWDEGFPLRKDYPLEGRGIWAAKHVPYRKTNEG